MPEDANTFPFHRLRTSETRRDDASDDEETPARSKGNETPEELPNKEFQQQTVPPEDLPTDDFQDEEESPPDLPTDDFQDEEETAEDLPADDFEKEAPKDLDDEGFLPEKVG